MGSVEIQIEQSGAWSPGLTVSEARVLLRVGWDTLAWVTGPERGLGFAWGRYELSAALRERRATFVTLHRDGQLRGCIGTLTAVDPLAESVHRNAVAAATEDPRFAVLGAEELEGLEMSVSILSPSEPIGGLAEFRVGEHGLILERGGVRAVFLPEVAAEQGWSAEETAEQLCRKAGLAPRAWRAGGTFRVFWSAVLTEKA
jgi:AmmeMemoRadiSam system protein A